MIFSFPDIKWINPTPISIARGSAVYPFNPERFIGVRLA